MDKINCIIENGWEYNEFQNFDELYRLLNKHIGTSAKYSKIILKIINVSSTILFHNCTCNRNKRIGKKC